MGIRPIGLTEHGISGTWITFIGLTLPAGTDIMKEWILRDL